jgi:phytanoyl-CoA hydroxylase
VSTATSAESLTESFRRHGYVVVRNFVNADEVRELNHALQRVIRDQLGAMPRTQVVYENPQDPSTLKQLQDLQLYDPFFRDILLESRFAQMARTLLADAPLGKTVEYFNKPPKIGKPTPPHQDAYYFMLKPPEALTMWLALEDADEENGCVRYARGSHLRGMRAHGRTQTFGFSQGIIDYGDDGDRANEVAIPARPGDLLIHHAMTIHRADGNASATRSRRAMGLIYFAASAREDKEAKDAYLRKLEAEKAGA